MKSLLKYKLTPLYALVLTICTYVVVTPFLNKNIAIMSYVGDLLTQRGPIPYAIVFMTFLTASMTHIAGRRPDNSTHLVLGLYGLSALPIIMGLLGSFYGFSMSLMGLMEVESLIHMDALTMESIKEIVGGYYHGVLYSWDTAFLGFFSTLITWTFIIWLCISRHASYSKGAEPENGGDA